MKLVYLNYIMLLLLGLERALAVAVSKHWLYLSASTGCSCQQALASVVSKHWLQLSANRWQLSESRWQLSASRWQLSASRWQLSASIGCSCQQPLAVVVGKHWLQLSTDCHYFSEPTSCVSDKQCMYYLYYYILTYSMCCANI